MQTTRTELVSLILEHVEAQGLNSYRYVIDLACMSYTELTTELARREHSAVYDTPMPQF